MIYLSYMNKPFNYRLFGLEARDILVYEAMLESPEAASVRAIASLTKQNRGTTFEIIKKLAGLGLVGSHYKNKRKYYFAKSPSVLKSYAEEVQKNISTEIESVGRYVSTLESTKAKEFNDQFTQFYDGEEEIAALLRDVLSTMETMNSKNYRVISSVEVRNHLYGKFKNFTRQRIKSGISVKVIGVGELGSTARLAQTKLLTNQLSPDSYIIIYGDKVAHISLSKFMEVQGVLILDSGIAKLHKLMFDHLWDSLR